jgi:hypothetical protein
MNNYSPELQEAVKHPLWQSHERGVSLYTMDGKKERWSLVYYPIFEDGKTLEPYEEPRALMQNIDKPGFWSKEVPLRYLTRIKK